MTSAYYNEIDPFAAEWLRRLIIFGHIAPGDVDERDIRDVPPDDLIGYQQHHFFAGIGVWSHALRQSGWSDERPVATGSCPCQPFSAAGTRSGAADERHLWPHFHHIIKERRFPVVFGEQVASKDGLAWFDLVSADMEGEGYTGGALDLCAAGFGAPHIRQRLYFAWLADASDAGSQGRLCGGPYKGWKNIDGHAGRCGAASGLANSEQSGERRRRLLGSRESLEAAQERASNQLVGSSTVADSNAPMLGRTPVDWLFCRDGKWRPVEPGTFPLAHGAAARVGRLRGYGNAIAAPVAQGFIESVMECIP